MAEVLTKAACFILIIILGYALKRLGVFGRDDYRVVSKIALNLTLPCAVISSFAGFKMDYSLFLLLALGFVGNCLMIMLALLLTRRETPAAKLFYIISSSGYNIGCFTLPFVHSFLGAAGVVALCMFDVGNSVMCTGMTYAFTASFIGNAAGQRDRFTLRSVFGKILGSIPFWTYMVMLALVLFGIRLPEAVYAFTNMAGGANTFICMLMIGMMFELHLDKKSLAQVREILLARYGCGLSLAALAYFYAPFGPEASKVLAAALMAPCTAIGPIFIEKLGGNVALAGVANSVSYAVSVMLLTLFFTFA